MNRTSRAARIQFLEFLFKNLNAILGLSEKPQDLMISYLYFINGNYYEYSALIEIFTNTLNIDLQDLNDGLKQQYLIFGVIIVGYIFTIILFGVIIMQKISTYQEKVLLLISRLSISDIDREVNMLQYCKSILQSQGNRWQQINFPNLIIQGNIERVNHHHHHHNSNHVQNNINNFEKKQQLNQKKLESNSQLRHQDQQNGDFLHKKDNLHSKATSSSDRGTRIKSTRHTESSRYKSQSHISSLLQGQKLRSWPFYLMFIFILLKSGVFFVVVIFLAYMASTDLDPGLKFMKQSSQFYNLINKSIFMSEQIVATPIFKSADKYYPSKLNETMLNDFQQSINNISIFMSDILKDIDNLKAIPSLNKSIFSDLYSSDVCQFFQDDEICKSQSLSTSKTNLRSILFHGTSSILTTYLQLFKNVLFLISINDETEKHNLILDYLNSQQNVGVFLNSYSLPMKSINLLFSKATTYCETLIEEIIKITLIYYMIIGSVLTFIQFILDYNIKLNMKRKVRKLNLALSFIPIPIAQDEVTSQILKSIHRN